MEVCEQTGSAPFVTVELVRETNVRMGFECATGVVVLNAAECHSCRSNFSVA